MTEFLTVKQTSETFLAFSEASLRYHLFHRNENGFADCIVKVGRKILIKRDAFIQWIEAQNV